ncbi:hypothetical protein [Kitasatospora sp. NPDC051914]|uniref:hypothetical protein n=1 Tax=Kitasatospora sp. NPDC051914 TaxID=3154945 RepID=UPI00344452F2
MIVLMLFIPPALLGILLLLGGFEERLVERLTMPSPDTPPPALPDGEVPAADDRLPKADT